MTTVERGSVTAAAKSLGVSPQAVSKSVNDLERSLGRPLFVRRATGLKPTPYGSSLYKKARHTLQEVRELEAFSQWKSDVVRSHVSCVLCIPRVANFASLSQRIGNFLSTSLGVPTQVDYCGIEECKERLSLGTTDAFITVGKTQLPDYDVSVIDSIEVGALMVDSHPLAGKQLLFVEDVEELPLYIAPDFPFFNKTVLTSFTQRGYDQILTVRHLTLSLFGLFNALATQHGCVIMPTIQGVDDWLPRTHALPFDPYQVPRVPLCLVTSKDNKTSYARALEELLVPGKGDDYSVARASMRERRALRRR